MPLSGVLAERTGVMLVTNSRFSNASLPQVFVLQWHRSQFHDQLYMRTARGAFFLAVWSMDAVGSRGVSKPHPWHVE